MGSPVFMMTKLEKTSGASLTMERPTRPPQSWQTSVTSPSRFSSCISCRRQVWKANYRLVEVGEDTFISATLGGPNSFALKGRVCSIGFLVSSTFKKQLEWQAVYYLKAVEIEQRCHHLVNGGKRHSKQVNLLNKFAKQRQLVFLA